MRDFKHTPGPWHLNDKDSSVVCANIPSGSVSIVTPIADVLKTGADRWREEEEANARLISAAPELLAIVEQLIQDPSGFSNMDVRNIEILIKKIKGE